MAEHEPGCCTDRRWKERNADHPEAARMKVCDDATCMKLPDGKRCVDCQSFSRCEMLFGVKPDRTICDFYPRRFRSKSADASNG